MTITNRLTAARRVLRRRHPGPPPSGSDGYPTSTTRFSTLSLTNGQDLTIAADAHYLYDLGTSPAVTFGDIVINGKLSFDSAASQKLTAGSITNNGKFAATPDDGSWPAARTLNIVLNGVEAAGVLKNAYMVDETASSGAGNGVLKRLWQSTSAAPTADETITVSFTSATAFNVTGSVSGSLGSGTVGTLFNNKVRFIATAGTTAWASGHTRTLRVERKASLNDGKARGVRNMAGAKMIFKGATKTCFTRLQGTSAAPMVTGNTMPLADVVSNWNTADEVVVTTTDYYYWGSNTATQVAINEKFTISSLNAPGKSLVLSGNLVRTRCAQQQYVQDDGLDANGRRLGSFSWAPTGFTPHVVGIPTVIDQRAWVLNLTRNIVFEGANDSAWTDTSATGRFGIHIMNMGLESEFILEYVEVRRGGQRGRHGRYPIHNHMPSYNMPDGAGFPSDGAYLGDCDPVKQRVVGCVVNQSSQHGVQNHAACGWTVTDTIVHDIDGHGFNTEDGSELRYKFIRCIASQIKSVPQNSTYQLKAHQFRASGFWITNMGGDVYDGASINCERNFWESPATRCFGLSRDVAVSPMSTRPGRIESMHLMCSKGDFMIVNAGPITDERGAVSGYMTGIDFAGLIYWPTETDQSGGAAMRVQLLKRFELFKAERHGYQNRVGFPDYPELVAADIPNTALRGAVTAGRLMRSLMCGKTLNHSSKNGSTADQYGRAATASYHNTLVNQDTLYVNFPAVRPANGAAAWLNFGDGAEINGGAVQSDDLYQNVIEQGYKYHTNNRFMSADPGVKTRMWNHRQLTSGEADNSAFNWSLSPGDKDWQGWWGPAGWWRTPNLPFYTSGLSSSQQIILGYGGSAVIDPYFVVTPDKIMGVFEITMETDQKVTNRVGSTLTGAQIDERISELTPTLLDSSYADVASFTLKRAKETRDTNLRFKRFFGVRNGKRYRLGIGTTPAPSNYLVFAIYNAAEDTDTFVIGFPWAGATAKVYTYSGHNLPGLNLAYPSADTTPNAKKYNSVASLAALEVSSGFTFYLDTAADICWVKYKGGSMTRPVDEANPGNDLWSQKADNQANTLYIIP